MVPEVAFSFVLEAALDCGVLVNNELSIFPRRANASLLRQKQCPKRVFASTRLNTARSSIPRFAALSSQRHSAVRAR